MGPIIAMTKYAVVQTITSISYQTYNIVYIYLFIKLLLIFPFVTGMIQFVRVPPKIIHIILLIFMLSTVIAVVKSYK